ncbi:MAG: restriction endonuclease subunit R, partial [Sulfuricurvum sp. PD_MW2]
MANDTQITYYKNTALKDENKKRKIGKTDVLSYLFEFLDAYDFGTDSGEEISSENKSLINPSVLGLIFEKLNGYKDGSFYTPSFITMYMARESITKSVLHKFNDAKDWNCQNLLDLHNKINDIQEANAIIDTLTICDPAVGSGHFLVSALNEILFIKSELGILVDEEGKRIRDHRLSIENDELIIKDDEGEIFDYQRDSKAKVRIQKTLFKEKQRIIEHSLFGVDINPNSVNICRLRLWIELLKNAYYREDGTLDTLPNIDINIKCGNSLISRFGLTDELKIKNIAVEIENYKQRVSDYKENLGTKRDVMQSISDLKDKFRLTLKAEWKVQKSLNEKLREYVAEYKYEGLSDNLTLLAIKNNYGLKQSLFEDKV